jgi:hypothetical protein
MSLDWTLAHHARGSRLFGVDQADDDVQKRMARFHTVVTAVMATRHGLAGLEGVVHDPQARKEEVASWEATSKASDKAMEEAHKRLLERLPHRTHPLAYRKRTAIVWEIVQQLEEEEPFPQAPYACDNGVMPRE